MKRHYAVRALLHKSRFKKKLYQTKKKQNLENKKFTKKTFLNTTYIKIYYYLIFFFFLIDRTEIVFSGTKVTEKGFFLIIYYVHLNKYLSLGLMKCEN